MLPKIRAYIDLDAICDNYSEIKKKAGPARVMAIVKADAYGHGAPDVAAALCAHGCDLFGVSSVHEARVIRQAGVEADILILGYTEPEFADELVALSLTQTVIDFETAEKYSEAAVRAGKTMKIHIKLDTGMGRIGFDCRDGAAPVEQIKAITSLEGLALEGVFTHFAEADDPASDFTGLQFERFLTALDELKRAGIDPGMRHAANSGAILNFPETMLDAVRPGLILYGLYPSPMSERGMPLKAAMSLEAIVVRAERLKKGEGLSYSRTYFLPEDADIATIAAGYADGYHRGLSNRAEVFINQKRAKIRGNICMDMCMIETSAAVGDIATLFGTRNGCDITVDELAGILGTINYELICQVGKRVCRIYCRGGEERFGV